MSTEGGGDGGGSSTAVAPMVRRFQYVWKPPQSTCWRGIYRWEDEEHEGWKAALAAFPYKVRCVHLGAAAGLTIG